MADERSERERLAERLRAAADKSEHGGGEWFQLVHRCREAADAIERLEAECERHRRANLVRTVIDGWNEDIDGALIDYINEHGWDAVPWKVAEAVLSGSREAPDGS